MKPEQTLPKESKNEKETDNIGRREAFDRFGKFAAYAAPFTVLAFTKKAAAATGTGPVKHFKQR
jgi:hypothetical protein